jgi:hypothetical protein
LNYISDKMSNFETIWAQSDLTPASKSDHLLKNACKKLIDQYLLTDSIRLIKINNDGYINETTFDIVYSIENKTEKMQVNYCANSRALNSNIPQCISFE